MREAPDLRKLVELEKKVALGKNSASPTMSLPARDPSGKIEFLQMLSKIQKFTDVGGDCLPMCSAAPLIEW